MNKPYHGLVDAIDAIMSRRSVAKMTERRPSLAEIDLLLAAAVRAPNHHLTQPWRFVVLTGAALDQLGEAMVARVRTQYAGTAELAQKIELERARPHRAPVILTVIYVASAHPKAIEREDRYSVGAAMQNILLAAHAQGLAAYLRTGPASEFAGVAEFLSLTEAEEVAGFIYLGYTSEDADPAPQSRRTDPSELTEYRGWDQT